MPIKPIFDQTKAFSKFTDEFTCAYENSHIQTDKQKKTKKIEILFFLFLKKTNNANIIDIKVDTYKNI